MTAPVHLISNESYDESEVWCKPGEQAPYEVDAAGKHVPAVSDPLKATCLDCLWHARRFGDLATTRREELLAAQARSNQ